MSAVSKLRPIVAALLLAALAGCGGGGDDAGTAGPPAAAAGVDKYVGTWVECSATGPASSERDMLVLAKASDTTVTFTSTVTSFTAPGCAGTGTVVNTATGSATLVGTKTVGTETVDRIDVLQGGVTSKQIVLVRPDGKFYNGVEASDGGPVDAQGYPNTIDPSGSTKVTADGATPTAAAVDKYVGTWVDCFTTGPASSEREVLVFTKASDTAINFTATNTNFNALGCTGTGTAGGTVSGTATLVGTKTIGAETVDRVDVVQGGVTVKQVVLVRPDGKFYSGVEASDGGAVDAQGYPDTIDPSGATKL